MRLSGVVAATSVAAPGGSLAACGGGSKDGSTGPPDGPYVVSLGRTRAAGPMPISRGVRIHAMGEERVGDVPRA
jgi:hypothetical protein